MSQFRVDVSPQDLDLPLCVRGGQVFRWQETAPGLWIGVDGPTWYKARLSPTGIEVQSNGSREDFERLFRLDQDFSAVKSRIVQAEPALGEYVAAMPGLRVMRPADVVEETFSFLCTPNNNMPRILAMVRGLATHGPKIDGPELHRFPSLETMASLPEATLRSQGFGYRARTIPSLARQILDRGGEEWLLALRDVEYQAAYDALVSLNGIGPKLADCIALFALHHTEAVPVDTHLWQAAVRMYFPEWEGGSLTEGRYRQIGDLFRSRHRDLAGWAHQWLFYDNMLGRKGAPAGRITA